MPKGVYVKTKKHRKKISEWMKGNKNGKGNKGKIHSKEWKKKQSERMKGRRSGHWKGGISKNKEYASWLHNKRNRMKRNAEGSHTFGEWELLKKQYNYICPACKRKEQNIKLEQDHIIPISKGGSDYIENIQPLCHNCNCKKHTKMKFYLQEEEPKTPEPETPEEEKEEEKKEETE